MDDNFKVEENSLNENEIVNNNQVEKPQKEKKKKRKIRKIIGNIIFTILLLVVVFEAVIGIINMQKINEGKEPVWCLNTKKTEEPNKIITEYNLGLYYIVRTETDKDTRIVLKLFFLEN